MSKTRIALTLMVGLLVVGCGVQANASLSGIDQPPWADLPDEPAAVSDYLLASLPVHPDASEPGGDVDAGFTTQPSVSICSGERCPTVHAATARYAIPASDETIEQWYWDELVPLGYDQSGSSFGLSKGRPHSSTEFVHPGQPDAQIELNFYPQGNGLTVVDVLAVYIEPLPKPDGPIVALDAERVDVVVQPATSFQEETPPSSAYTVTDPADIARLAERVNSLPVRPDYVQFCMILSAEGSTTLTFHASDGESWVVRIVAPGCPFRVELDGYPPLTDQRGLLRDAVREAIGEAEPNDVPSEWPGRPDGPTPDPTG